MSINKEHQVEWYTVQEVANIFQVHNSSVYREIEAGAIPSYKFGKAHRVPRSWVDSELARFRSGRTIEEVSQTALVDEGRRIARALAAAERVGAL